MSDAALSEVARPNERYRKSERLRKRSDFRYRSLGLATSLRAASDTRSLLRESDRQAVTTLCTTTAEDVTSTLGRHTLTKTMRTGTLNFARLESSLGHDETPYFKATTGGFWAPLM